MISDKQLALIMPTLSVAKRRLYLPYLLNAMAEFGINTRSRAAAFIANLAVESMELRFWAEIWQGRPDQGTAAQHRYDVRADLGNTPQRDGDGYKYRGRGPIQTTGKANYRRVSEKLGLDDLFVRQPELLERPEYGFRAAAFFWSDNRLNRISDLLRGKWDRDEEKTFKSICKIVNGGYNGLPERVRYYKRAVTVLRDESVGGMIAAADQVKAEVPPSVAQSKRVEAPAAAGDDGQPAQPNQAEERKQQTDTVDMVADFSMSASTRRFGQSLWARTGGRAVAFLSWVYASLEAGNIHVILGVAVAVALLAVAAYVKRRSIVRLFHVIIQKVSRGDGDKA